MRQIIAENFALKEAKHPFVFENPDGHTLTIYFVSERIVRVRYLTPSDHSLSLNNHASYQGTTCIQKDVVTFETKELRVVVTLKPAFHLSFFSLTNPQAPFAQDLAFRSYGYDPTTHAKWHYQKGHPHQFYYGLGEKSGALNLAGRRLRLERLDSMGYDAESSDPLYKFCPFFISLSRDNKSAYGIYYNNFSRSTIDLGQEIDAMWGSYTYYQCDTGPIDYYMIYGPSVPSVVQSYSSITSRPRYLPPRYSLGYLASSMGYAESDNAQSEIESFIEKCIENDIPCDGIHLSSGYTVNDQGDRCVFTWNKKRFPDPEKLAHHLKERGIYIFANIKPWLLQDAHPHFEQIKNEKGLVWDGDGPSSVMQWRGGRNTMGKASYIDFSSVAGYHYWKSHVKSQLLEKGYQLWLDNNEFTLADDGCTFACHMLPEKRYYSNLMVSGPSIPTTCTSAREVGTSLQTLMMIQASYEAVVEHNAIQRPFLISRSATPFANELVSQTWSGDNTTAWKTIKYNIPMGLSAGLSNMPAGYGHDVGGFAGPKPDSELFVRWVQQSVFWPRFCIHSWNNDGSVTEPWMYPEVTPIIRSCIHFRYKLIPYLYTLYVQYAYYQGEPLIRPIFYHHQDDTNTYDQSFEFMLGPSILVAPVYEPGQTTRQVYLPSNTAWYHYQTGQYFDTTESTTVTVGAPLDSEAAPFFVKAGSMMCFGKVMQNTHASTDNERRVQIFPPKKRTAERSVFVLYEDDGDTLYHHTGKAYAEIHIWMETTETEIFVGLEIVHDGFFPYYDTIWVTCPIKSETRKLIFVEDLSESRKVVITANKERELKIKLA